MVDPDKSTTEWSVGYLYDLLDQRMTLTGVRPATVLLVLNQLPREFGEQLARHGHLGVATAQRGLPRGRPVLVDFSVLPVWKEQPGFYRKRGIEIRRYRRMKERWMYNIGDTEVPAAQEARFAARQHLDNCSFWRVNKTMTWFFHHLH